MNAFAADHAGAVVRASPNFGPRAPGFRPEILLLHYTGMATGQAAEDWLCNPEAQVSSHYLVHEDGGIVQMVQEADRAWHAGKSLWRGVTDINSQSIGIEIVNPGHQFGYRSFPRVQIGAVVALCRGIIARHSVRPEMVLAHSDVALGRKIDPGEKFPWARLARAGVGHFVRPSRIKTDSGFSVGASGKEVEVLQSMLARYGYGVEITGTFELATAVAVTAFQRHFRPARVDGIADRSTLSTLRLLLAALE